MIAPTLVELNANAGVADSNSHSWSVRMRLSHFVINGGGTSGTFRLVVGERSYRFDYAAAHGAYVVPFPIVIEPGTSVRFVLDMVSVRSASCYLFAAPER